MNRLNSVSYEIVETVKNLSLMYAIYEKHKSRGMIIRQNGQKNLLIYRETSCHNKTPVFLKKYSCHKSEYNKQHSC